MGADVPMKTVLSILPPAIRTAVAERHNEAMEEIRLRMGHTPCYIRKGQERTLSQQRPVNREDLQFVLHAASNSSLYSFQDTLRQGFLTLPGGHRIGVCGEVVWDNNAVRSMRDFSSVSIRIAHEHKGIGMIPKHSTLIVGPPGCGKTSLLRDCVRLLSGAEQKRVALLDERGEIAASRGGLAGFDVGSHTDILTGCHKAVGITMLLRTMNPQWIAVDEITQTEDVHAMVQASYCGVRLLATAHADSFDDLQRRPVYRELMQHKVFEDFLVFSHDHRFVAQRGEDK